MPEKDYSAAIIAIGDELLRGDTQDTNTHFLTRKLHSRGVSVKRCFIIPDEEEAIAGMVMDLSRQFDVLCVCGGIGPTPDDITRQGVARALGVELELNELAAAEYKRRRGGELNAGQREMCCLPAGCALLWSQFPSPPGFKIGNIYVLPGVPQILQSMWEAMKDDFKGAALHSAKFSTKLGESRWAHIMCRYTEQYPALKFGSYPKMDYEWRVDILVQGLDGNEVEAAAKAFEKEISQLAD